MTEFEKQGQEEIRRIGDDPDFLALSRMWLRAGAAYRYPYHFTWLGRPAIQIPQDTYAMQELIWAVKPDVIIETGIAHGGSLIVSASMLALLDYADAVAEGVPLDPRQPKRKVIGVDIDIRPHNRAAIEAHPMASRIEMIQGSSIAPDIVAEVVKRARPYATVMLCLDSNHTHDHVLAELEAYAPLVTPGSYCIVMDTGVEDLPDGMCDDRPWGKGNNPKTAVREYLKTHPEFEPDKTIEWKIAATCAPDGFLKRIR